MSCEFASRVPGSDDWSPCLRTSSTPTRATPLASLGYDGPLVLKAHERPVGPPSESAFLHTVDGVDRRIPSQGRWTPGGEGRHGGGMRWGPLLVPSSLERPLGVLCGPVVSPPTTEVTLVGPPAGEWHDLNSSRGKRSSLRSRCPFLKTPPLFQFRVASLAPSRGGSASERSKTCRPRRLLRPDFKRNKTRNLASETWGFGARSPATSRGFGAVRGGNDIAEKTPTQR